MTKVFTKLAPGTWNSQKGLCKLTRLSTSTCNADIGCNIGWLTSLPSSYHIWLATLGLSGLLLRIRGRLSVSRSTHHFPLIVVRLLNVELFESLLRPRLCKGYRSYLREDSLRQNDDAESSHRLYLATNTLAQYAVPNVCLMKMIHPSRS